jgi:CHAD domain-containing protein
MPNSVTPSTLLLRQIDAFCVTLPGIRDGGTEAIHNARVATRRMRELLPLVGEQVPSVDTEQVEEMLQRVGKRLGRARDVEMKLQLLASLEPAVPVAAGEMGRLRLLWRERRDRLVRRSIKTLERLKTEEALTEFRNHLPHERALPFGLRHRTTGRWEDALVQRLRQRAGDVREAIERAGGVIFPTRLHATRVAIKKLRYAMEIATATGVADFERQLRPIRKAQDLLGGIHDHDVLAESLKNAQLGRQRLLPLIELNRQRLHERYLRRRDALLDACGNAVGPSVDHWTPAVKRTLIAASVPLALAALPLVRRGRSG